MENNKDCKEVSKHENIIDFESLPFKEPIKELVDEETKVIKEARIMSCMVADDEKPQESTEVEVITKEGDVVSMTHRSVTGAR